MIEPNIEGEPPEELMAAAYGIRRIFYALVSVGFTESQALTVVSNIMTSMIPKAE